MKNITFQEYERKGRTIAQDTMHNGTVYRVEDGTAAFLLLPEETGKLMRDTIEMVSALYYSGGMPPELLRLYTRLEQE